MMWIASLCVCVSWQSVFPSWRTFSLLSAAIPCLLCWIPTRGVRRRRQARYFVTVLRKIFQTAAKYQCSWLTKRFSSAKRCPDIFLNMSIGFYLLFWWFELPKLTPFEWKVEVHKYNVLCYIILTRRFLRQVDLEKALAIQVDDPIPFMQLLAKNDSGITEVTKQLVLYFYFYDIAWTQIYH